MGGPPVSEEKQRKRSGWGRERGDGGGTRKRGGRGNFGWNVKTK